MGQLNKEQRVFLLEEYLETKCIGEVKSAFEEERNVPSESTIWSNVEKYHVHGTRLNRNARNSGKPKSAKNVEEVRRLLQKNPHVEIVWDYRKPRFSSLPNANFPQRVNLCNLCLLFSKLFNIQRLSVPHERNG